MVSSPLILASASSARAEMLGSAGLRVETVPARIDEAAIRRALEAEQASARGIADALAEAKARKIGQKHPEALVLGCDQVLVCDGNIFPKPDNRDRALAQLEALSGKTHQLLSAAVLYDGGEPTWRHVGVAQLTMRELSVSALSAYLDRNWPSVADSVGGYKIEEEGVRLMTQIRGDHFTILGLPLIELLNHLILRGVVDP